MPIYDFGKRRGQPCSDCDADGHCTMNCGPAIPANDEGIITAGKLSAEGSAALKRGAVRNLKSE